MKKISIIIPCYNEEKSLPLYFEAVDKIIPQLKDYTLDFVLVNDGSKDATLEVMNDLYMKRNDITIVSLSRNYGQNPAFAAGLQSCTGDYAIMMDADLQDPVEMILKIAEKFSQGYEVVNPHRVNRMKDSYFKRKSAKLFYVFINKLEGRKVIPENVNCFRGISRRVIDEINKLTEKDRYILAEVPLVGFKTTEIDFAREERQAGESKYTLKKMIKYACDNMASSTAEPLFFPLKFGVFSTIFWFVISLVMLAFLMLGHFNIVGGMDLIMVFCIISFVFFGLAIVIDVVGLLGVYLHNILINTRNRPTYLIEIHKTPEDKKQ